MDEVLSESVLLTNNVGDAWELAKRFFVPHADDADNSVQENWQVES